MKKYRNLTRYDKDDPEAKHHATFKGWRLHLTHRGTSSILYFSDLKYGSKASSRRAARSALKTLRKQYGIN